MILQPGKYNGMGTKNNTQFDYIEIGTCDWDVMSMTKPQLKGIIIEPIKLYLDNIPYNKNVIKINSAISNEDKTDYMFYIPPNTIEKNNIVNCFRGMNKLGTFHMGHVSNNLINNVEKEECIVQTYFTLLNKLNVSYVDFLKIDTEGHDCLIINNILDNLELYPTYILPQYIYFENNSLTDIKIRTDTIYRLWQHGYVHIFTQNDNTFMYNCRNYYQKYLFINNIVLHKNKNINTNNIHYFQNVHSYIEYGQYYLFKNILNLNVDEDEDKANIIWSTQDLDDYNKYKTLDNKVINIIHGGGEANTYSLLKSINKPNILVKSIIEYTNIFNKTQVGLFIGKYESLYNNFTKIYEYRQNKKFNNDFIILNGFFKCNNISIINTYNILYTKYDINLYGYDSVLGWGDTLTNDININILSKYKFNLHLKGLGYLCNSVLFSMMAGIPTIMSYQNYHTLYNQFIPEDLIILYDNTDANKTNPEQIIPVLDKVINMSNNDYNELSQKIYIHGTFFRKYYKDELEHLFYFINILK